MFEFLLSLILTVLPYNLVSTPSNVSQKIISNFQTNPSEIIENDNRKDDSQPENTTNKENLSSSSGKIDTYNTRSEKYVGHVASIAVENADPLVPCSELNDDLCKPKNGNSHKPTPTPFPSSTPTPTPQPIITIMPPKPTPPICIDKEVVCPQIICFDEVASFIDPCTCSCIPYSL